MEVIKTELTTRGTGTEENPHRIITQYWDTEGNLIFQVDPTKCVNLCSGDTHCSECPA